MKLLVNIEQYDVVGILPSQLDHIALLAKACNISKIGYIDGTCDGFPCSNAFVKYKSIKDFLSTEEGPFIVLDPKSERDIRDFKVNDRDNSWLIIGPAMGWPKDTFNGYDIESISIPTGTLSSRDAVSIAIWETSKWLVQ